MTSSVLADQAGVERATAQCGAVTLIQRFGSALNLNVHLHMLWLDGVYEPVAARPDKPRLRLARALTSERQTGSVKTGKRQNRTPKIRRRETETGHPRSRPASMRPRDLALRGCYA